MMPGVEPNRPRAGVFETLLEEVHQRAFAAAPSPVDPDRQRWPRLVVAQEEGQSCGDGAESQRIGLARFERLLAEGFFAGAALRAARCVSGFIRSFPSCMTRSDR